MGRRFKIFTINSADDKSKIVDIYVSDYDVKLDGKPRDAGDIIAARGLAATFPISQRFSYDEQEHRAKVCCDYLNKIAEVTETAVSQAAFIDIIAAKPVNGQNNGT